MSILTDVEFDDCRTWIRRRHNKGYSWDEIRMACKSSDKELADFLEMRIDEFDWPMSLDVILWKELVNSMEEAEYKKIKLQQANRMAELHDFKHENNRVSVPQDERSSWQLYKKHLKESKHFSEDAIQKIEDASIGILKRLSTNTVDIGPIKGLVIGNVQSGKTANMAGLMAMAADWRWNMFIVLSGTIESLRKQTQSRLHSDLNHPGNLVWTQFDHLSKKKSPVGQRLCDLQLQPDSPMRYMTVCLKIKSRLQDLIEWIEADQNNIKNLRILVIDDEADQASVNTGDVYSEADKKTINRLILNLVHCRNKSATSDDNNTYKSHYQAMNYISYTATPYANCLNEIGPNTLYPTTFIRTLDIANSYFGPERFFEVSDADQNRQLDVVREIPSDDIDIIKDIHSDRADIIPESMKEALEWFLCAAAITRYYGYKKPVSMLVHTSQKQLDHEAIANAINCWLSSDVQIILNECRTLYTYETTRFTKKMLRDHYPNYEHPDEEIWDYPDFSDLENEIMDLLSDITSIMMDDEGELKYSRGIHLCIDNCANNGITDDGMHVRLAYPDDNNQNKPNYSAAFIVIGGNTLSRGLTLEGLVSTYFLRSVKQADTLMQMGRWFGYRPHYELLQRVWMTEDTADKFSFLSDIDADLREQIYQMQLAGKTPEEFNLALLTSPRVSWLSLTAKKKMQGAVAAEIDFSGMDTQLTVYSKSRKVQENNIRIAEAFINSLGNYRLSQNTTAYIWEKVPFRKIAADFFAKGFSIPDTSRAFQQIDLLNEWIEDRTYKNELTEWNVLLCGVKTDELPEQKIWKLSNGIEIGKINRSCKTDSGDHVNIGVLSGKKDYVADITPEMIGNEKWEEMITSKRISNEYKDYRRLAGIDKTPLFLIYMIDRNSKPLRVDNSQRKRKPLNMDSDLIGITMVIPGIRGSKNAVTRLKIKPITVTQEVED